MGEWRAIETAPKDRRILLWWPTECGSPVVGRWHDRGNGHWYSDVTECTPDQGAAPTHWMPLPDPPTNGVQA